MFKKGYPGGLFKKTVDSGHIGVKHLPSYMSNTMPSPSPNSNAPKVSSVLQKVR